jgi:hypothetical protein
MQDSKVSSAMVISFTLWGVVIASMISAFAVGAAGWWHLAAMLSQLGCATSAAAATAEIRRYVIRMCALMRRLHGVVESPVVGPDASVRTIHSGGD